MPSQQKLWKGQEVSENSVVVSCFGDCVEKCSAKQYSPLLQFSDAAQKINENIVYY